MKRSESLLSSDPNPENNKRQKIQIQIQSRGAEPPASLKAPISPPLRRARIHSSTSTTTTSPKPIPANNSSPANKPEDTIQSNADFGEKGGDGKDENRSRSSTAENHHPSPSTAAVEAGHALIDDHLSYFSSKLSSFLPKSPHPQSFHPRLPIPSFIDLYKRNQNPRGRHFVIHQHDHPIAGTHYDLRLQISATSSISWAVMYGVPGDPNSRRQMRNASETRVHNLWNHLIETASHATGSLLIWDTGEYEILPRKSKHDPAVDPDSQVSEPPSSEFDLPASAEDETSVSEPEKLAAAFQARKINIRLHGTRLPRNYTLRLRLTKGEDRAEQPRKPAFRRGRFGNVGKKKKKKRKGEIEETPPSSDIEHDSSSDDENQSIAGDHETVPSLPPQSNKDDSALERELQEQEDEAIRLTNAYPGATNSIGSIHQRKWLLSMDREASGFVKEGKMWKRRVGGGGGDGVEEGFRPFWVRGPEGERSVVTGRNAQEVMADEGVVGFRGRRGWRAVLE